MLRTGTILLAALALVVAACTPTDETPTTLKPPANCWSPDDPERTTHIEVLEPCSALHCQTHVDVEWAVVDPCGDFYVDVQLVLDNDCNTANGVLLQEALLTDAKNATGCCYMMPALTCAQASFIVSARDQSGPIESVQYLAGPVTLPPGHNDPPDEWNEP